MTEHKSYLNCTDQGMALVLVLVFTAALLVLGTALITYAVNEKLIANYNSQDIRLYYIAEAGIETGIAALQQDFYYDGNLSGSLDGGSFTVSFKTVDSCNRDVISVGTLDGNKKTITLSMELKTDQDEPIAIVKEWYKPNLK